MSYIILNISDSDKHWLWAIQEYTKRLWNSVKLEEIKPSKNGTPNQIIQKDTDKIIEILERKYKDYNCIMMSKDGEICDTETLEKRYGMGNFVFIIGGPYGLDEEKIDKYVKDKISFWKITLPHGLAKLTLLEQIYRIGTIRSGKKYHY